MPSEKDRSLSFFAMQLTIGRRIARTWFLIVKVINDDETLRITLKCVKPKAGRNKQI